MNFDLEEQNLPHNLAWNLDESAIAFCLPDHEYQLWGYNYHHNVTKKSEFLQLLLDDDEPYFITDNYIVFSKSQRVFPIYFIDAPLIHHDEE